MRVPRGAELVNVAASHEDPQRPAVVRKVLFGRDHIPRGQIQMVNWAQLAVGRAFQAHYHEDMREVFVIVRGSAIMRVQGASEAVGPGDGIIIEPGEVHVLENVGQEPVDYVVFGVSSEEGGRTVVVEPR